MSWKQGFFFETTLLMCAKVCEIMIHTFCQVSSQCLQELSIISDMDLTFMLPHIEVIPVLVGSELVSRCYLIIITSIMMPNIKTILSFINNHFQLKYQHRPLFKNNAVFSSNGKLYISFCKPQASLWLANMPVWTQFVIRSQSLSPIWDCRVSDKPATNTLVQSGNI